MAGRERGRHKGRYTGFSPGKQGGSDNFVDIREINTFITDP